MQRLTGVKKLNVAVFISGKGSNFRNLIKYSLKKILNLRLVWLYQINQISEVLIMRKNFE